MDQARLELLKRKARTELKRRRLVDFTTAFTNDYDPGWVHHEVAAHLEAFMEAVERRLSPRLMIFLPPRTGKSQLCSRCFPAYMLGHHPNWEIICATYGQELADDMGRYVRSIINDPAYAELFPATKVAAGSNAADRIDTTARGGYRSVGRGGSLTGRGAHVAILDDPIKDDSEADSATIQEGLRRWYLTTLKTRLAPGGGVIIVQTLWSLNDLPLFLMETGKEDPLADKWCVYKYPAIATEDEKHRKKGEALHPSRFPLAELEKTRANFYKTGMSRWWNSLYQQTPVAEEGNFFKKDWIERYAPADIPKDLNWYIGADLAVSKANTADHTAIIAFGVDSNYNIYVDPEITMERLAPLDSINRILELAKKRNARLIATDAGPIETSLDPLIKMRMNEMRFWPQWYGVKRTQGKHIYAAALSGRMQQRKVFFPRTRFVDETLIPELLGFVAGADNKHDNLVDALSNGMMMLADLVAPHDASQDKPKEEVVPWSSEDIEARKAPRRLQSIVQRLGGRTTFQKLNGRSYDARSQSRTVRGFL